MATRTPHFRSLFGAAAVALLGGCGSSEITPASKTAVPEVVAITDAETLGTTAPGSWTVLRVGGSPDAALTLTPGTTKDGAAAPYYAAGTARLSAALPEGYPPPTAPGAIELKVYGAHRQAVVETDRGQSSAFFPLFRHISSRRIAMTSPVVMTGEMAGEDTDGSSMAFLYRSPDLGPVGRAEEGVVVEDSEPVTVITIAFQGRQRRDRVNDHVEILRDWLAAQPEGSRWLVDGDVRLAGYNGPEVPRRDRWWEVQIPVRWSSPG